MSIAKAQTVVVLFVAIVATIPTSIAAETTRVTDPKLRDNQPNELAPVVVMIPASSLPRDVPRLGEGYDLLRGARVPTVCIAHGGVTSTKQTAIISSLSQVTDDEMLWRKLNTSIEAKASYAGFSGGGSYSETIETRVQNKSITVVAKSTVLSQIDNLSPSKDAPKLPFLPAERIDLNQASHSLLANNTPADFRRVCGDGYVAQISHGGEFSSVLEFREMDFLRKRSATTSLNAAGPADVFSASGSTQIQEEMKKNRQSLNLQMGTRGGENTFNPTTMELMIERYKTFPADADKSPGAIFLSIRRYDALPSVATMDKRPLSYWVYAEQAIRQFLRLQSVRNDFADGIEELTRSTGLSPATQTSYVHIPEIEVRARSIGGYRHSLQTLQKQTARLGKWVANCLNEATKEACTPADKKLSLADYDDLPWRAIAPMPVADISPQDLIDIRGRAESSDPESRREAGCYFAKLIQANEVRRIAVLRQRYDNSGAEDAVRAAELKVYEGLNVSQADCKATDPAPADSLLLAQ